MRKISIVYVAAIIITGVISYYAFIYSLGLYVSNYVPPYELLTPYSREIQLLALTAIRTIELLISAMFSIFPFALLFGYLFPQSTWRGVILISLIFLTQLYSNASSPATAYLFISYCTEAVIIVLLFVLASHLGRGLHRPPNQALKAQPSAAGTPQSGAP